MGRDLDRQALVVLDHVQHRVLVLLRRLLQLLDDANEAKLKGEPDAMPPTEAQLPTDLAELHAMLEDASRANPRLPEALFNASHEDSAEGKWAALEPADQREPNAQFGIYVMAANMSRCDAEAAAAEGAGSVPHLVSRLVS